MSTVCREGFGKIVGGAMARVWLAAFLLGGCALPEGEPEHTEDLLPSLQVYTSGGEVTFVLQVTNMGDEPIDLRYRSGQSFDFVVKEGERDVWRWSEGQMFTQALREERLMAGESINFEAAWQPGSDHRGSEYVAVGILTASNHHVEQSTRFAVP